MNIEALAQGVSQEIAEFRPRTEVQDGHYSLLLPDFEPLEWRPPLKRKFLSRRNPNEVFYEEAATAALRYFFRTTHCRTFLDVGAQWGYYATLALSYKPHPIDTYAFEINPLATEYLERAIEAARARGRRGELLMAGLSDSHLGEKDIWISITKMFEKEPTAEDFRDPWWVRLKFALRGVKDRDRPKHYRMTITSIDHFCSERGLAPDMLKIDVDGYEATVIPGGMKTFAAHKPVLFLELHKRKFYDRFNLTRRQIATPLFELGYQALLLDDHHNRAAKVVPVPQDSAVIDREATDMFIFVHPDRMDKAGI